MRRKIKVVLSEYSVNTLICFGIVSTAIFAIPICLLNFYFSPEHTSLVDEFRRLGSNGDFHLLIIFIRGVIACIPLIFLHNLLHIAMFRLFGVEAKVVMQSAKLRRYLNDQWILAPAYKACLFAPTIFVNVACYCVLYILPHMKNVIAVAMIIHMAGCFEDWWIIHSLRKLSRTTLVSEINGVVVVATESFGE